MSSHFKPFSPFLKLREMNEDRVLLSKEFKKEHEKDMMELSDKHSREIKKLFREKREVCTCL